jgi:hypothetical protein
MEGKYSTSSIDIAAYLLTIGAKLESIDGKPPDSTFLFLNVDPKALTSYWTGEVRVAPQAILHAYKHLTHRAREAWQMKEVR